MADRLRHGDAGEIAAITFNTRAAEELRERLASALEPLGVEAGAVRVRTFHALGLEILRDSGAVVEPLVDRMAILRQVAPAAGPAGWRALDTAISRLKLDMGVTAGQVAADEEAGPTARTFVEYERAVAATGGLDFDDLVARALALLELSPAVLRRWRARCGISSSTRRRISTGLSSGWRCSSRRRRTASSSSATTISPSTAGDSRMCAASCRSPTRCRASAGPTSS